VKRFMSVLVCRWLCCQPCD